MRVRGHTVSYPAALAVALFVVMLLTAGYAATTSTAAFGTYNPNWDGAQDFRDIAAANGDVVVTQETTAYTTTTPAETTAFVLSPTSAYDATDLEHIRSFIDAGGRLVVASDKGGPANDLLRGVGASTQFDTQLVRDDQHYYRSPALPIATNVSETVSGVETLTLNYGTVVNASSDATVLVRTSEFAYLDENRNGDLDPTETMQSYPVAVEEPVGNGSVVAVSDPSVFINTMLARDGNRGFATHLVSARDRTLMDYSHASQLPLGAVAVIALKESPLLQLLVGAGIVAVAAAIESDWARRVGSRIGDRRGDKEPVPIDDVVAAVSARHPEWDEERVRRVTQSIRRESAEQPDDD